MHTMILEYEFSDGAAAQLEGPNIKYWAGEGLPVYEGSLEGFAEAYPAQFAELLRKGIIHARP